MAILSKLSVISQSRDARLFGATSTAAFLYWIYCVSREGGQNRKQTKDEVKFVVNESGRSGDRRRAQVQVNREFFKSLRGILRILVPGFWTAESGFLILVAATLVVRSMCDIWMIHNGTLIESSIISMDLNHFLRHLVELVLAMPAISLVNNVLKYGLNEMKLRFRTRLSNHLYDSYLKGFTYYKMNNLDNRISNADQLLTQDVEKFCDSVVELYSNISKPILDILIYVQKLTQAIGGQAPGVMILYLILSGSLLTHLRRPISRLTVTEQRLEGEFRFVNSRLITNSEEVAFYQGNSREKKNIDSSFNRLVNHLRSFIFFRFNMGFIDNIIAKYLATCVGFTVVAYPYLTPSRLANSDYKTRMQDYYKSGRMLVKLAEAIGRLVLAGRELTRLAGFTARVQELLTVLKDLNTGTYKRTMLESKAINGVLGRPLIPNAGKVINEDNVIRFEKVPLVTPNGDVLVEELNFEVKSGMNVLVCGPNGCGKSSLFRILGELWPVFGGCVTKPSAGKLFYIPQRPYMTLGTLRDQVTYPDSYADMVARGYTDNDLRELLGRVQLSNILDREGGWNAIADWMDVLSGGEKQRIAMARLFYHKPQFAILDECTSAVSVDVEDGMYQYCRQAGISLFTVSHRKSLWKHHEYYLHMDGRGSFEFKLIQPDTQEFGS
ncbi:LOW QUALITY PROTEIN: ATP-binding cassette sub-family D member 3 [Procambarus clarkii]|uniref:LOW QUALITY PROTEIN: ATP-binding cassette sub-family D member 3 n=1 Tax=Procambarus clarkii TaxID=6728 RepID=UPI001E672429|nr:ATP-binding cassette sub-family D member 3-like [Procambarus clarkii]